MVFDGRHLAAKAGVEAERRESRKAAKAKAKELIAAGKHTEARSYLQRALDVSHTMALELIDACHDRGIDCIVAPYEADGQLAYLSLTGIAEYVITEDSDLILFGCKKVLFKFSFSGGLLVEADKLHLAMGVRKEKFTFTKFRHMCILSGCDYLASLPGIGLAKAKKFLLMTEETDMRRALGKIPSYLGIRQIVVTDEYKEGFLKAEATFQYMIVYDSKERKLTRLNEPENGIDETLLSNSGEFFEEELAYQLALGNIDPMSLKKVHNWDPDDQIMDKHRARSIWCNNKENGNQKRRKIGEPLTEDEIQAEHMRSIKMSLFSNVDDNDIQIQEEDLVSTYFVPDSLDFGPPKKKLRTSSISSPRKSSNIFKAKPKSEKTPIKSPLTSPHQFNVSLITFASTKTKLFDSIDYQSSSKSVETHNGEESLITPQKDLFAIAKQKTEEVISPAAFKLLKMVQEKLQQPQVRRVRVSNEVKSPVELDSSKESDSEHTSPEEIEILTPNEDSVPSEIETSDSITPVTQESDDLSSTPIAIEPSIILIEDDTPIKFTQALSEQPKLQTKLKPMSRPSGLSKRKGPTKNLVKSNSSQMRLTNFGFMANKKL